MFGAKGLQICNQKNTVEVGYNVTKGTEYFVSL
jgi:hypothetical protein